MKDLGKKKLLIIAGAIVGVVILIIIILLLVHSLTAKKGSFKDAENKMLSAAKSYYKDNETLLPKNNGGKVTIDATSLAAAGYMKDINSLVSGSDGVSCSGQVIVTYNNERYRYTPLLDCGEKYSSKTLVSYIQSNEEKVYTGQGLYDMNGELVYRGENPNNYIEVSGKVFRIVKISDGSAVLIYNEKPSKSVWDDRFNTDRNRNEGINDYSVSRIKESLNKLYDDGKIISESDKSLLEMHTLYTGKRGENDSFNDGSIEKSGILEYQYIGLLPLYDYINASIDTNCMSASTRSCGNYNYLNHYDYNWWTLTGNSVNSYQVYRVDSAGEIDVLKSSTNGYIRPVIHLVGDAIYVSGDGSQENPYTIK